MPELGPDSPKRQSQVVLQMERMEGAINSLESVATELVNRLDPLLRLDPLVEEEKKPEVEVSLVSHANNLRVSNQRISGVHVNLSDALGRLEF